MIQYQFKIPAVSGQLDDQIQAKIDQKTKPPGSLGQIEALAFQIARVQKTVDPQAGTLHHYVFAADHGVTAQNISPFPAEVTQQMVMNFLQGGAAINVFAAQHQVPITIVDAGVAAEPFAAHPLLVDRKVAKGTTDFSGEPAMTEGQWQQATESGADLIRELCGQPENLFFSFGEMGIGNTTAGAALMAAVMNLAPELCVGRGTGASQKIIDNKVRAIQLALKKHGAQLQTGAAIMQHLGGFELAMMAGAMAAVAAAGRLFIVDGFLATAALLCVSKDQPEVLDYAIFGHCSNEQGHKAMLEALGVSPLLQLNLRLGEGTGAVLAWPLIQSSIVFINNMASFESAGVSQEK
ncbi:nicotinate-nucleotide--dimethylbenzimidazole phosphoribosyltransferase [Gynuella sp.]|uniref:nicotinate-nucleotide--dimethylbenzimidazole phosphoribosyltransferase n=1 Tax=Gynuella sp. TaxID=2969146 RepID=UPI003D0D8BA8